MISSSLSSKFISLKMQLARTTETTMANSQVPMQPAQTHRGVWKNSTLTSARPKPATHQKTMTIRRANQVAFASRLACFEFFFTIHFCSFCSIGQDEKSERSGLRDLSLLLYHIFVICQAIYQIKEIFLGTGRLSKRLSNVASGEDKKFLYVLWGGTLVL